MALNLMDGKETPLDRQQWFTWRDPVPPMLLMPGLLTALSASGWNR